MLSLKNKVTLITGSSSGIGKATALAFAEKGAYVVVHYHKNKLGAEETLKKIKEIGSDGLIVSGDMKDRAQIKEIFEAIEQKTSGLDILINNAGGIGPYADFENVNFDEVDDVIASNLIGPMYASQCALKYFKKEKKKGVILSTSSIHDCKIGGEHKALAYCASKAGLRNMTEMLARAAAPDVRVNAVSPGPVLTEVRANDTQETIDYFSERCLIGRWVAPEEIAHSFIFLAENEGATGTVLYLDGGFRA